MAGKYENILNHQDCISEERMLAYIEGRLSPQEANRVEQHLQECELCPDALEGMRLLNPDKARAITTELNSKIDQRLEAGTRAKVIPFGSFYRIAAIIIFIALVGGGYWLMKGNKEENVIALNQKPESADNKNSGAVQFEAPAGSVTTDGASDSLKSEIVSSTPKFSVEDKRETVQPLAYSTTKEVNGGAKSKDDVGKPENEVLTSRSDTFYTGDEVALSKVENSNVSQQQSSNAIENYSSSRSIPAAAPEREVSGAVKNKSSEEFAYKKKKVSESEDEKSIFQRGKSNYDMKNFDLAANDFEKLVKDTASRYYDDSKWYLANCYMRTNRNTRARKLLQEISNSNSVHKKEAFGLLQE